MASPTSEAGSRRGTAPLREWLATGALLVILFAAYFAAPMRGRWWPLGAIAGPLGLVALVPMSIRHTKRILASAHPLSSVARAIAAILVLLVLGFATTYYVIETHAPDQLEGLRTKIDALYFTVTVLTTVGFGDIHPTGQLARAVTTFHMLANLLVVGVSVRLVVWAGRRRVGRREGPGPFSP